MLYEVRNCIPLRESRHKFRIGAPFATYVAVSRNTTRQSIVEAIRALPK